MLHSYALVSMAGARLEDFSGMQHVSWDAVVSRIVLSITPFARDTMTFADAMRGLRCRRPATDWRAF